MPIYKVPAEEDHLASEPGSSKKKRKNRQPTVHVPVAPKDIGEVTIGDEYEMILKGKIMGVHMSDDEFGKESNVRLAVDKVDYYPIGEVDKVFDEAEEDS